MPLVMHRLEMIAIIRRMDKHIAGTLLQLYVRLVKFCVVI